MTNVATPMPSSICAIIPTYNRSAMLKECLDSILAQSRPPDEIIVVNDGSTDDTESAVKAYGTRVTLINKANGGKSSALNIALAQSKSDYIWICDDDDIAAPDGVEHLAAALDADGTVGFAFGTFRTFHDDDSGRSYSEPIRWGYDEEPNINIRFLEGIFTLQYALLVRRSLYMETGRFREDLLRSQDHDMMIRLSRNAKAAYVPKIIFFLRMHDGVRGSSAGPFSDKTVSEKGMLYGQKIFSQVRKEFRLEEFTPTFALQWGDRLSKRAALLQRACVFAECGMWDCVIDDLNQACAVNSVPATPEELRLAERITRSVLPWKVLNKNSEWVAALRMHYRTSLFGHQIIDAACRPIIWRARSMLQGGRILDGIQMLRILTRITGIRGAFSRALSSMLA
jgi:glycosyltransferase involved in cell wall biosynthesis